MADESLNELEYMVAALMQVRAGSGWRLLGVDMVNKALAIGCRVEAHPQSAGFCTGKPWIGIWPKESGKQDDGAPRCTQAKAGPRAGSCLTRGAAGIGGLRTPGGRFGQPHEQLCEAELFGRDTAQRSYHQWWLGRFYSLLAAFNPSDTSLYFGPVELLEVEGELEVGDTAIYGFSYSHAAGTFVRTLTGARFSESTWQEWNRREQSSIQRRHGGPLPYLLADLVASSRHGDDSWVEKSMDMLCQAHDLRVGDLMWTFDPKDGPQDTMQLDDGTELERGRRLLRIEVISWQRSVINANPAPSAGSQGRTNSKTNWTNAAHAQIVARPVELLDEDTCGDVFEGHLTAPDGSTIPKIAEARTISMSSRSCVLIRRKHAARRTTIAKALRDANEHRPPAYHDQDLGPTSPTRPQQRREPYLIPSTMGGLWGLGEHMPCAPQGGARRCGQDVVGEERW